MAASTQPPPPSQTARGYLSCPELARLTGYSRMQIQRLARANRIPSRRITSGGRYRFHPDDALQEWIWRHESWLRGVSSK